MLREELGWSQQKSDELLLPVIQRVNRRGAAAAANKQSNLDGYFGDPIGGSAIPRKRQAYSSKRLQKVVTDYREDQRRRSRTSAKSGDSTLLNSDHSGEDIDVDGSDDHEEQNLTPMTMTGKTSKRTTRAKTAAPTKRKAANERKAQKPSKNFTSTAVPHSTKRKKRTNDSDDYGDDDDGERAHGDEVISVPARPRPKPVRKKANTNPGAEPQIVDQERNEYPATLDWV